MKNDLKDPKSWIPKNLFESYCGTNSENLIKFYDKAAEKKRMNLMSLNWMAILLLPAWLGYRKQWAILITFTIMFSIIPFVEALFDISIPSSAFVGGLIVIGFLGNSFVLMDAHKQFITLKQKGLDEEKIRVALKDRGSPSVGLAVLSLVSCFVAVAVFTFLADILFGLPA